MKRAMIPVFALMMAAAASFTVHAQSCGGAKSQLDEVADDTSTFDGGSGSTINTSVDAEQ